MILNRESKIDEIMNIKDRPQRHRAIAFNLYLFSDEYKEPAVKPLYKYMETNKGTVKINEKGEIIR